MLNSIIVSNKYIINLASSRNNDGRLKTNYKCRGKKKNAIMRREVSLVN